jgi:hypothetical protein
MTHHSGRKIFGQSFVLKFRTKFYPQISDKVLSSNFGQSFILKFRTKFYP